MDSISRNRPESSAVLKFWEWLDTEQAFDGVMQALATGQKPDPQTVQQLIQVFNSFITEEEHEGEGEPEGY